MNIFEQIAAKRAEIERGVQSNIEKSFDTDIEKATYADTPENRKLGRVGQEYHRGKDKKEETGQKHVPSHEEVKTYLREQSKKYGKELNEDELDIKTKEVIDGVKKRNESKKKEAKELLKRQKAVRVKFKELEEKIHNDPNVKMDDIDSEFEKLEKENPDLKLYFDRDIGEFADLTESHPSTSKKYKELMSNLE